MLSNQKLGIRVYTKFVMIMELRVANFATSKNLVVKSTMFPHHNINKFNWTSPDGKTHNQIDHVLIGRRWHSSVLHVRSFMGVDHDTAHYLVVEIFRERRTVSKQTIHRLPMKRFNLKKLDYVKGKGLYRVEISNRFAALENSCAEVDINTAWATNKENIKISARESRLL
jgi:hypothetical protein